MQVEVSFATWDAGRTVYIDFPSTSVSVNNPLNADFEQFIPGAEGHTTAQFILGFENPKPRRVNAAAAPASLASVFLVAPVPLYFLNFFIHGCLAAFVESYLLLFVATEWPATPNWFLGLLILIAAVFEIPVFLYANRVIEKIGVRPCLVGAQLLFALRCTAYATLARYAKSTRGYLWFVLLEPSHALTFAMMWSATVSKS